jgi:hypothetical protein
MLSLLILLLIPPVLGGLLFYFSRNQITVREFVIMEMILLTVVMISFFYARMSSLDDVEHWNGRITGKTNGSMNCCHCRTECDTCWDSDGSSYSCNCHEVCDHSADYYWNVQVSTGDSVTIRRCEPNRHRVPRAWIDAFVGEAASVQHTYTNYLRADSSSLLREEVDGNEGYRAIVPPFPSIYSHYKVNKLLTVGGLRVPPRWRTGLREINADLGRSRQVDVVMVFVSNADPTFADALAERWLKGPKNALTIVSGVGEDMKISWVRVITISRVESLKITLRDGLTGLSINDPETALDLVRQAVANQFVRTPMAEFEYLASAAAPSPFGTGLLVLMSFLLTGLLSFFMAREDVMEGTLGGYVARVVQRIHPGPWKRSWVVGGSCAVALSLGVSTLAIVWRVQAEQLERTIAHEMVRIDTHRSESWQRVRYAARLKVHHRPGFERVLRLSVVQGQTGGLLKFIEDVRGEFEEDDRSRVVVLAEATEREAMVGARLLSDKRRRFRAHLGSSSGVLFKTVFGFPRSSEVLGADRLTDH